MTSFYKYLLPIFCFACVSATATSTKTKPQTPTNANIVPASYIVKPDFKVDNSAFPSCDCDEQGKPLVSCQEQTIKTSVRAVIDKNGLPMNIAMVESTGSARADRYIIQRFRSAKFSPTLQNNQAIISSVIQPINLNYMPKKSPVTCEVEKSQVKTSQFLMALPLLLKK